MQKKVLILNTSHNELGLILALKSMDLYVISTGNISGQIGEQYVDEHILVDYSNKELILEIAKSFNIDYVCACCNDSGVITAAYVAEKLGLPGHDTYENALILHHKDLFKKFAQNNGITTPHAKAFEKISDAKKWLDNVISYPVIV